ncbi:MAG TPA: class I SAM-dependent methyltransferase [Terriglobia bacterium]|nr:class I SAM-dependent methyltransferase [Terriglobia bacterium]
MLRAIARWGIRITRPAWTRLNELALNIQTEPCHSSRDTHPDGGRPWWRGEFSREAKHDDNNAYAVPDYWYIRKIVKILGLTPADTFYDIGAGMGRVLCLAARRRVRKCVGIELSETLCRIARMNAQRLRGRKCSVQVVCGDAATADLSAGTIYFMFNPFGPDTMRDFLSNLNLSLEREPRNVRVVYYNCVHRSLLDSCGWLEPFHEFRTSSGLSVAFWRSCRVDRPAGTAERASPTLSRSCS